MRANFGLRFWSILGTFWGRFRRHFGARVGPILGLIPGPFWGPLWAPLGINFGPIFGFIPGNKWQTDKVENDEAEHDKVVRMKKNNPSKMGPYLCVLACFKTFTFVGATKMGSCGAVFSLAGGGKGKEGKTADLQNGKVQNDDAEGGRVAPKRETTRALRARQKKETQKRKKKKR